MIEAFQLQEFWKLFRSCAFGHDLVRDEEVLFDFLHFFISGVQIRNRVQVHNYHNVLQKDVWAFKPQFMFRKSFGGRSS